MSILPPHYVENKFFTPTPPSPLGGDCVVIRVRVKI